MPLNIQLNGVELEISYERKLVIIKKSTLNDDVAGRHGTLRSDNSMHSTWETQNCVKIMSTVILRLFYITNNRIINMICIRRFRLHYAYDLFLTLTLE